VILSEPPHPKVGWLLLINPESFAGAIGQPLGRQADSWRLEMLAEKIEAPFHPAHGGLVRVLGQFQAAPGSVQFPDCFPWLPPGGGQDQDVIHIPEVFHLQALQPPVQRQQIIPG
jgi:hypothetical protein